jgi:hypothetical protein
VSGVLGEVVEGSREREEVRSLNILKKSKKSKKSKKMK